MEKDKTATNQLNNKIKTMTLDRTGYTLRKTNNNITKQALEWNPQGKRKRGRSKNSWRRGAISELQAIHTTWGVSVRILSVSLLSGNCLIFVH